VLTVERHEHAQDRAAVRAHARSGDRLAIAGYLGSSAALENALADLGEAYADVTESDHRRLAEAAAAGRVRAQSDL
jgi:thiamine monophosphate kinase